MTLYAVYFMSNAKRGIIYIGSTNDLRRRIPEHQSGLVAGFTKTYKLTKCVYFELCPDLETALRLERRYKKYPRHWKINLIERANPEWGDLSEQFNALLPF